MTRRAGPRAPAGRNSVASPARGHGLSVHAAQPEALPPRKALAMVAEIETLRQGDLEAPGQPRLPPLLPQEVGRRGERVRNRGPDVAPAVAVAVDRVFEEARRHELGLAHRSGPGAKQFSAADVLLLQDLQRVEEFVPEEVAAVADEGEGRERAHHVDAARERAEVRLHAPDAEHDRPRHAVNPLDAVEGLRPLPRQFAPARQARRRDRAAEVLPDRLVELGLLPGQGDDFRVERDALERRVEGGAQDAASVSLGPQRLDEALEVRLFRRFGGLPRRLSRLRGGFGHGRRSAGAPDGQKDGAPEPACRARSLNHDPAVTKEAGVFPALPKRQEYG